MQPRGARDDERFPHEDLGAAVPTEPRLADPLFQIEIRPDVGRHVRQPVFTPLPPACEPLVEERTPPGCGAAVPPACLHPAPASVRTRRDPAGTMRSASTRSPRC